MMDGECASRRPLARRAPSALEHSAAQRPREFLAALLPFSLLCLSKANTLAQLRWDGSALLSIECSSWSNGQGEGEHGTVIEMLNGWKFHLPLLVNGRKCENAHQLFAPVAWMVRTPHIPIPKVLASGSFQCGFPCASPPFERSASWLAGGRQLKMLVGRRPPLAKSQQAASRSAASGRARISAHIASAKLAKLLCNRRTIVRAAAHSACSVLEEKRDCCRLKSALLLSLSIGPRMAVLASSFNTITLDKSSQLEPHSFQLKSTHLTPAQPVGRPHLAAGSG